MRSEEEEIHNEQCWALSLSLSLPPSPAHCDCLSLPQDMTSGTPSLPSSSLHPPVDLVNIFMIKLPSQSVSLKIFCEVMKNNRRKRHFIFHTLLSVKMSVNGDCLTWCRTGLVFVFLGLVCMFLPLSSQLTSSSSQKNLKCKTIKMSLSW